jgi:hypothetical protein
MGSKGRLQMVRGVLYAEVSWVYGAPGMETIGLRGRCSEAVLCTGSRGEVEGGSGWVDWSERPCFQSVCACVSVQGATHWAGKGAGRGARRDGCTMPCTPVCRMARVSVCAHGNAHASRGVSGRRRAHAEQGRGVAYGVLGRQGWIGLAWRW